MSPVGVERVPPDLPCPDAPSRALTLPVRLPGEPAPGVLPSESPSPTTCSVESTFPTGSTPAQPVAKEPTRSAPSNATTLDTRAWGWGPTWHKEKFRD